MFRQPPHIFIHIAKGYGLALQLAKAIGLLILDIPQAPPKRRDTLIRHWCCQVLNILNVRVITKGSIPSPSSAAAMFVANHISWVDILILSSVHRMYFVAKAEVRGWRIIGWIAARAGSFFLDRERSNIMPHLTQSLREGKCVCMFPEDTTTDGTTLKPFHGGLFQAAVDAQAPIWPVTIRYRNYDGTINRTPAFLRDQSLLRSIINILAQDELYAELHFGKPISSQHESREELVRGAEHAIASRLQLIGAPRPSKRLAGHSSRLSSHNPTTVA